jgi:hypothetical protein
MNKRIFLFLALGLSIPSVALAAELSGAGCCPGLCCLFGCPNCP